MFPIPLTFSPPFSKFRISIEQLYSYERQTSPLARVEVEIDDAPWIRAIETNDSPDARRYELPPFRIMTLELESEDSREESLNPNHGGGIRPLQIGFEGSTYVLDGENQKRLLHHLNQLLDEYDPDILFSRWGDSYTIPKLLKLARHHQVSLRINRDPTKQVRVQPGESYISYGRIAIKQHLSRDPRDYTKNTMSALVESNYWTAAFH